MQHAHEHGLVHRDMKPSNLMLAEDGSVKILDLGLAGFAGEQFTSASDCNTHTECDDLTLDGQIMGTAEYIAPEQAENSRDVDIRADIYGLGCTLYSLLAGVPPFQRQNFATPKQLINAHQPSDRPSIADLPPELARIIDRMLAIDPSGRFSTPAEVSDALSPFTINAEVSALLSPKPKSTSESDARKDSNPVDGRLWKAILQKKVLVTLAVIAFAAFGIVFNLKTPYGTVEIETDDKNVEISVSQAGKEIEIINAASGWDIRLKEGKYDVSLKSGDDKFKLSNNTVTVSRGDKTVLRVTLKNKAVVVRGDPHRNPEQQAGAKTRGAGDYLLTVDAKKHVAAVKLLTHTSVITIPANREYTISCAGKARSNNNGGDDLFPGVVLYYQDKNDSDGNNSIYTVLQPGKALRTGEIFGDRKEIGELRAFFVESSNGASNNSGRYTLRISGANGDIAVVDIDSIKHVQRIDKELNAACLEIPSGLQYKVSCSGSVLNNTNGGDDPFYGVLVFYQDTMDSDGNRSVYRVLRDGESFVTDTIYGEGIGKLRACFLESHNGVSNNRGHCTIRVQETVQLRGGKPGAPGTAESRAIQRLRKIGVKITEKNGVATGFTFGNSAKITDADLAALESLDTLENFTLIGCVNVTDQEQSGRLPLAGFFAQGEIGPVAGKNYIHGFTASVALFE